MGLARAEQETILRWDEDKKAVSVYSASPVTWRKLARLGIQPAKETTLRTGEPSGKFYRIPLAQFRWGLKRVGGKGNPEALAQARRHRGTPRASVVRNDSPDGE